MGVAAFLFFPYGIAAQVETGSPFMQLYDRDDHPGDYRMWDVAQDHRGFIYAANSWDILEFDGATWRQIRLRTDRYTVVNNVFADTDSTVYVGAEDDVGYLAPDSLGQMAFVSLRDRLPEGYRDVQQVEAICSTSEGVFIRSKPHLYRITSDTTVVVHTDERIGHLSCADDTAYVQDYTGALGWVRGDRIEPATDLAALNLGQVLNIWGDPNGERFVLRPDGFYHIRGDRAAPFATDINAWLAERQFLSSIRRNDGSFALVTNRDEVVLLNPDGQHIETLGRNVGLPDEVIRSIFEDRTGSLWLGQDTHLARVDVATPVRYFQQLEGIESDVSEVIRYQGRLHFATRQGLHRLEPGTQDTPDRVVKVGTSSRHILELNAHGDQMVGILIEGGFAAFRGETHQVLFPYATDYVRAKADSTLFFIATNDGL